MVSSFSMITAIFVGVVVGTGDAHPSKADIIWDGRLPRSFARADLDNPVTSPFNVGYNKGQNQTWADIISFPRVASSLFDAQLRGSAKSWALNINDNSIFIPGDESSRQGGFRRSEVMPNINSGDDATVQGITTLHFSVRKDEHRPLNESHMYHVTFLETADYASHIWTLNTGKAYGDNTVGRKTKALRLESSTAGGKKAQLLFQTDFGARKWHNFAVQVDFNNNALNAFYSTNNAPLKQVVKKGNNDSTGKGQYHVGLIKHPTGETEDVVRKGYQQSGINESIVFGGVFIERGVKVLAK